MSHSYEEVMLVLHACVSSSKDQMIPLKDIDYDFQMAYGCPVPYRELGFSNLKSFPVNLPCIYIVEDDDGVENAMFHRSRSLTVPDFHFCSVFEKKEITEFDGKSADTSFVSQAEFSKLETMLPLFYNHQALGDDFFLDLAETKFRYFIPPNGPAECGLCSSGQTINELIQKLNSTVYLAPKVVLNIGIEDILRGRVLTDVMDDFHHLIVVLINRHVQITLITLIKPLDTHYSHHLDKRIKSLNRVILKYKKDPLFTCDVVDMYNEFKQHHLLKEDCCNAHATSNIFSKRGRKIFLNTLKRQLTKNN